MFWAIEAIVGVIMVTGFTVIIKTVNADWDSKPQPEGKHRKG